MHVGHPHTNCGCLYCNWFEEENSPNWPLFLYIFDDNLDNSPLVRALTSAALLLAVSSWPYLGKRL